MSDGPLIVQSDKTLLLEVAHELARECRAAIAPFAELERSPEHVHPYRVTPLALWNARAAGMPRYAATLRDLLRPGGRLLNHAIAESGPDTGPDTFVARFVFPDGELLRLGDTVTALEAGGLEVLDVEALRRHYALTLRAWLERLDKHWDAAVAASDEGRARVWRLYMAGSALAFETGKLGVNQVLARRPGGEPPPLRRTDWM